MSKLTSVLAGVAVLPVLVTAGSALAAEIPTGQFEGGNVYRVANLTKTPNPVTNDFKDPATATCNETVLFRVRIHNVGAYKLENVKVQATLPTAAGTSHSSKVTLSASNGNTVTDTAGVNLDKAGKLVYVNGSTELLDSNQSKLGNLADGIVAGGVTLSDPVGVSIQQKRSVQFQAKVTCDVEQPKDIQVCELSTKKVITIKENQFDTAKHSKDLNDCKTTVPGNITVCELATKKVVTIKETEFDAAKHSKDLNKCGTVLVTPPVELAKTGPAETVAVVLGAIVAGTVASRLFLSRRTSRN